MPWRAAHHVDRAVVVKAAWFQASTLVIRSPARIPARAAGVSSMGEITSDETILGTDLDADAAEAFRWSLSEGSLNADSSRKNQARIKARHPAADGLLDQFLSQGLTDSMTSRSLALRGIDYSEGAKLVERWLTLHRDPASFYRNCERRRDTPSLHRRRPTPAATPYTHVDTCCPCGCR